MMLTLSFQFMMHSALDYLDEVTSSENRGRTRAGNTKWIGKLCSMEETLIYGESCGWILAFSSHHTLILALL